MVSNERRLVMPRARRLTSEAGAPERACTEPHVSEETSLACGRKRKGRRERRRRNKRAAIMPRLEPSAAHKRRRCAGGGRNAQRWATMRSVAESRDSLKGRPTGNQSCSCRAMDRQAQTAARDTQNAWGSGVPPAAGMQNGGAGGRGSWTPVSAAPRAGQQRSAWLEGRNKETSDRKTHV